MTMSSCIRILNRLNQPDSEDTDIENLKSEMETLVDKAEQIEANLENIEHIDQQVQIVVNNYDEEDNENSLDDEVKMITSDIGEGRGKGKTILGLLLKLCSSSGCVYKGTFSKAPSNYLFDSQLSRFNHSTQRSASRQNLF